MQQKGVSSDASSARGALQREHGPTNPSGTDGEHSGQKPGRNADRGDDEAPETPTDEPSPIPVQDPPSGDRARPPLTVRGGRPQHRKPYAAPISRRRPRR
jgi:hypothetical protein